MRTTIAIDDGLLLTAKHRARQRNCTLGQLVEASLRDYLSPDPVVEEIPSLPISPCGGGLRTGVDLSTNAAIYELLDAEDMAHLRAQGL